jgi:hypothetical protein
MTEELEQLLKNLKLRRILEIYDEQLRAADKDDISYSDWGIILEPELHRGQTAMREPRMPFLSTAASNVLFGLCRESGRWLAAAASYLRFGAPPVQTPAGHPRSKDEASLGRGCRPG